MILRQYRRPCELVAVFGLVLALVSLLAQDALRSPFTWVDDHEILSLHDAGPNVSMADIARQDFAAGRFRPVYYAIRIAEVKALGANPRAFHLLMLMRWAAAGVLTYAFLRLAGVRFAAALIALLLMAVNEAAALFWKLGPSENVAGFFFAGALVLGALALRDHHVGAEFAAVVLLILAALCKESFIPALPLAVAAFLWATHRQSGGDWRSTTRAHAAIVGISGAALLFIAAGAFHAIRSHGGLVAYEASDSVVRQAGANLWALLWPSLPLWPAIVVMAVRGRWDPRIRWAFVLAAVWLGAQLLVHLRLAIAERYLFPGTLLPIVLGAFALERLLRDPPRRFLRATVGLAIVFLVWNSGPIYTNANGYAAEAMAYSQAVDYIAAQKPSSVGILGAVSDGAEFAYATRIHLRHRGWSGPIVYLAAPERSPRSAPARVRVQGIEAKLRSAFAFRPLSRASAPAALPPLMLTSRPELVSALPVAPERSGIMDSTGLFPVVLPGQGPIREGRVTFRLIAPLR
ncbi:MAG: hypothetical protein JO317_02415 [Verrucomicrobiae bacterium]|nr:hypothetical protein [Verrucomicrobiae bacterium]